MPNSNNSRRRSTASAMTSAGRSEPSDRLSFGTLCVHPALGGDVSSPDNPSLCIMDPGADH
eukprot:1918531-Rhodomonas_salina.1